MYSDLREREMAALTALAHGDWHLPETPAMARKMAELTAMGLAEGGPGPKRHRRVRAVYRLTEYGAKHLEGAEP
jgi:hypothetical protein